MVWASDSDAFCCGCSQLVRLVGCPVVDPEQSGWMIYLTWPGNASGPPEGAGEGEGGTSG